MNSSIKIPDAFFLIFEQEGISLENEGVKEIALPPDAAVRAIEILRIARVAIKGGEVWEKFGDRFKPTYDGWNLEREDCRNEDDYVEASLEAAKKLAIFYMSQKGDFYITIGL
ncbi:hypothetical protein AVME950_23850 [Acidovorax sp. SUPP950]|uniref:Imm40 family immunity protein n=1 Tax=Acidovorax sp. SUPP950 TaxID=511901 RepID=UPI0023C947E6|nr:Imm40 family immunity protein [Acidovorax sp. SUPP950]GKS77988.1 hypothetical protein AVME950_23850 [Acidovorax sp. SUPP950]